MREFSTLGREQVMFVPSLHGQQRAFANDIAPLTLQMSKVISLGNVPGCNVVVRDSSRVSVGHNLLSIRYVYENNEFNPKWNFIVGANEIFCLNEPGLWTRPESNTVLRRLWFNTHRLETATVDRGRLVTHAGLSYGEWVNLGRPGSALEAAVLLNDKYRDTLYMGEGLVLGDAPNFAVNPVYGHSLLEVLPSWVGAREACPFDQVLGSVSLNNDLGRGMWRDVTNLLHYVDDVKLPSTGSVVTIRGARFVMLDVNFPVSVVSHVPEPYQVSVELLRGVDG